MLLSSLVTALLISAPPDSVPKAFSVLPLPLIYYTPETRLAYGVAATATFRFRRDMDFLRADSSAQARAAVRPSQITLGFAYTQNKQILFYLPFQIFYDRDTYYVNGEAGYYRYNYYFYGVGQQEVARELYGVNFPRIRINAFRRIAPAISRGKLYAGIRYQYEDYQVTSVEPGGLLASGSVPGGLGSRLSGAGLGLFYDSRNVIFFPSKGVVADIAYLTHNQALGGNVRFGRYTADVSSYHSLSTKAILAVNYFVSLTTGEAPFNALSLLGGTKRMRGYYEGRYRDQNVALIQSEVRFDLYKRLGGVVFGAAGILGDAQSGLRVNEPKLAYGAGLRFTMNRRDHLNIRLDYGLGRQSNGFYLTIGEAF
ncbi:BamA/TamA family outer membrane protein [Spirosoma terrae]|uniref:BamA/TamA family outer membrane protein n=1 Tax=Spirosoma terrae TaxID=1968276 RepID=A0A6L9LDR4_9BACT|nr:BamA/TamA family outer membrane protein [Spirosoma terrae]NDU97747.1 BamA/TamA family outer membrane protein [Spirosoma terrae]